jgi:hypothetical protein
LREPGVDVDGKIIIVDLKQLEGDGVDWLHVIQNKVKWWDIANTVMNL